MDVFRLTPLQSAIKADLEATEIAIERHNHVSEASAAEISQARAVVDAAINADMPTQFYVGLRVYLAIYDAPMLAAEMRVSFGE